MRGAGDQIQMGYMQGNRSTCSTLTQASQGQKDELKKRLGAHILHAGT